MSYLAMKKISKDVVIKLFDICGNITDNVKKISWKQKAFSNNHAEKKVLLSVDQGQLRIKWRKQVEGSMKRISLKKEDAAD